MTAQSAALEVADCWNKIGVSGNRTCPELARVVHCRNCPVYSAAGRSLLERDLPVDYRRYWTEYFSREKKRVNPGRMSVVLFRIGREWLALSTTAFQQVVERRTIHSLPHRRNGIVLGLINVRGELRICVSLGRLLRIETDGQVASSRGICDRLVVAEWQGSVVTFPVDEVYGVQRFHPEELKEAPATVARANPSLTRGLLAWNNQLAGCLDEESLFSTLNRSLA